MSKWPKKWLDAFSGEVVEHPGSERTITGGRKSWHFSCPERVLDALDKAGALREPEKPREFWICSRCWWVKNAPGNVCRCDEGCGGEMVHVREITDG